jgi:hypothetical protein
MGIFTSSNYDRKMDREKKRWAREASDANKEYMAGRSVRECQDDEIAKLEAALADPNLPASTERLRDAIKRLSR